MLNEPGFGQSRSFGPICLQERHYLAEIVDRVSLVGDVS